VIIRKSLYGLLALAVMLAFSPLPTLQAASLVGPGAKAETGNMIVDVAKKKKKKGKKKKKKAAASKAGKCGTYMYWGAKAKKCLDTRTTPPKKK